MKSMIGLAFVSGLALAACSPAAPETGAKPAAEAAPEAKITGVERLDPAIDAIIKPGELPVMVALLKILRVKVPDRSAFTSSVVDFRIEGPHAYLDNIELSGDAISLVGNGEVDFDSNVNLVLRPIMGEAQSQLPAMKRVLGGASGQFLLVHVDGTLADPLTSTEAFPTLAAAAQRLQSRRQTAGNGTAWAADEVRR